MNEEKLLFTKYGNLAETYFDAQLSHVCKNINETLTTYFTMLTPYQIRIASIFLHEEIERTSMEIRIRKGTKMRIAEEEKERLKAIRKGKNVPSV